MYYVHYQERRLQYFRIAFLTNGGLHFPFECSTTPTKVVLHFRKIYNWWKKYKKGVANCNSKFLAMKLWEVYYLKQACRGLTTPGIGPVYSAQLHIQLGHGIGNFSTHSSTGSKQYFGDCPRQWAARRCLTGARSWSMTQNIRHPTMLVLEI